MPWATAPSMAVCVLRGAHADGRFLHFGRAHANGVLGGQHDGGQHQDGDGHRSGNGGVASRHQHHRAIGEHAGQNRGEAGQHLGGKPDGAGEAVPVSAWAMNSGQDAQRNADQGRQHHDDGGADDGVTEAAPLFRAEREAVA